MSVIRVLVVEDQPLWQELLLTAIAADARMEVVGVASDGESAVKLARKKQPDAILMDIEILGEMNGIEAGLLIKEERPETAIVILSSHMERGYVTSLPLNRSSGWAYILKHTVHDLDTVVRTVQEAMGGMVVLDPEIVANMQPKPNSRLKNLTNRQVEILSLIAQGYNNSAISEELSLTESTVETYINGIYQELGVSREAGVHSRVTATLLYIEDCEL